MVFVAFINPHVILKRKTVNLFKTSKFPPSSLACATFYRIAGRFLNVATE
jgi:hypothetical protein